MSTKKPRCIAMIPARGGSVSIPKKNIKPLAGRPLIDWVIKPAIHSGCFAEVWVSTDDVSGAFRTLDAGECRPIVSTRLHRCLLQAQIAQIAEQCGAKVHWRAPETATSTASTESAILDFVGSHPDYDILCLIQATSPFIAPDDFIQGLELLQSTGADSLVTAVRAHRFMWSVDPKTSVAIAKNYEPLKRPRRQDWDGELIENGAFYLTRKAVLQKHGCRLGGKMVLQEMAEHTFTELDSLVDWEIVAGMSKEHGFWPPAGPYEKRGMGFFLGSAVDALPSTVSMSSALMGAAAAATAVFLLTSSRSR